MDARNAAKGFCVECIETFILRFSISVHEAELYMVIEIMSEL